MKVYIVQVIPEASLGKVSQEGYSRAERSYKQIYFSGGFYYGNYYNERNPRL